ncbi:MAG: prepilin-type N-terminal cleavage/methylation domain-containing protein [Gemmatimonadetes bacterium]|nr:prepilin-type N-terminal cleavage/methylation domain-containing protein [Gemmatimonadota bacterium]
MTTRRAFTLVEVLVALTVLALAVAALASTLTAGRRLRLTAQSHDAFAINVRNRVERLAARCGVGDISGVASRAWGSERWRSVAGVDTWSLADSLTAPSGRVVLGVDVVVTCRH